MDRNRSIRATARTTVILTLIAGPISWLSTAWLNSPTINHGWLFGMTWISAIFGIALAGFIIAACLAAEFGKPASVNRMFAWFSVAFPLSAVIVGIATAMACSYSTGDRSIGFDSLSFCCVFFGNLLGLTLGFFVLLGIHLNNAWTGEATSTSTSTATTSNTDAVNDKTSVS